MPGVKARLRDHTPPTCSSLHFTIIPSFRVPNFALFYPNSVVNSFVDFLQAGMPDITVNYCKEETQIHPLEVDVFFRQRLGLLFSGLPPPSCRGEGSAPVVVDTEWFSECRPNLLATPASFTCHNCSRRLSFSPLRRPATAGRATRKGPLTRGFKESMTALSYNKTSKKTQDLLQLLGAFL